jgi:hypothetical protein
MRIISVDFDISHASLFRHKKAHIPEALAKSMAAKQLAHADAIMSQAQAKEASERALGDCVMTELSKCLRRVNLIYDACDEYLRDPTNPEKYDIGPRAEDVSIIYTQSRGEGEKEIRRKRKLSEILADLEERAGFRAELVEVKRADPRDLALKALAESRNQLALLVDIQIAAQNIVQTGRFQEEMLSFVDELEPGLKKRFLERLNEKRMLQGAISLQKSNGEGDSE